MDGFNSAWIEIFRVGDYGDKGRFTTADLAAMVKNFQAGLWKPPLVIGHPENDSPAHGWVKDLRVSDAGSLEMLTEKISPELERLVREARFPNRSIAIYMNPKGTGPAVRHVGFLGGMPPEVKGLAPVRFATFADDSFTAIEFSTEAPKMQPTHGRFAVANLGLAQRAEQIQMQARARGNKEFTYSEASRIAQREFSESGADSHRAVFSERAVEAFAEADLPRSRSGMPIIGTGRAKRIEALQAEAAKDGKKLSWEEGTKIVKRFEEWNGWNPDKPITFSEAQSQARSMRGQT